MRALIRICLGAALGAVAALHAWAGEVTLHADDGELSVDGRLVSYDGAFYTLETTFGPLTLHADRVRCEGDACPDAEPPPVELTFAGAPLIGAQLMPALIEGFARARDMRTYREIHGDGDSTHVLLDPEGAIRARFRVTLSDSDSGLIALLDGRADVAMSLDILRDEELRVREIARDALVPAVAEDNDLGAISVSLLADTLAGKTRDWDSLGRGAQGRVELHLYPAASGIQQAIEAQLLGPEDLPLADDVRRHPDAATLAEALDADADGLGITLASRPGRTRGLTLAGDCSRASAATQTAMRSGDYPLMLPLYLHTRAERLAPITRDFLDYLATDAAAGTIRRAGFVDLLPHRFLDPIYSLQPGDGSDVAPGSTLPDSTTLPGAERVTTTIRFESDSTRLDAMALDAVARLADAVADGLHGRRSLVFAGFTDATETADALADERAAAVRDAVRAALSARGLGDVETEPTAPEGLPPAACDDSAAGRAANRRVEIWLR